MTYRKMLLKLKSPVRVPMDLVNETESSSELGQLARLLGTLWKERSELPGWMNVRVSVVSVGAGAAAAAAAAAAMFW